jgi:biopolymer transport protein ExbD
MLTSDPAATGPDLTSREITVVADKTLPYDVLRKVMGTCTAASYGRISLAVMEKEKPVAGSGANPT